MCKGVKVKPKMHWRHRDTGDARNMKHLLRSQPKKRPCELQMASPQGQGYGHALWSSHHENQSEKVLEVGVR
jgi:hypothetical protein